ncbi:lyase [Bacillus subtilis]|nr:lyase [Bacillus subtilis]
MKIKSIEPTPSPNTMKVILTEELPAGKSNNYKPEQAEGAPLVIAEILKIDGVKGYITSQIFLLLNGMQDTTGKTFYRKSALHLGWKVLKAQKKIVLIKNLLER